MTHLYNVFKAIFDIKTLVKRLQYLVQTESKAINKCERNLNLLIHPFIRSIRYDIKFGCFQLSNVDPRLFFLPVSSYNFMFYAERPIR